MSRNYLTGKTNFDAHVANKSNPHNVTAIQVGAATTEFANNINHALGAHEKRYNNPHMVTAEQVQAIQKNSKLVADLNDALENGFYSYNDGAANAPSAGHGWMIVSNYNISSVLQIATNSQSVFYRVSLVAQADQGNWQAWHTFTTTADLEQYLPVKDAMTLSTFFYLNFGLGTIYTDANAIAICSKSDANDIDQRGLYVTNDDFSTLQKSLFLRDTFSDHSQKNYLIFGEHNPSLLANTIQNLIQTGEVRTLDEATKATLSSIEAAVQKNYAEVQQESADAITLDLLERGVI